MADLFFNMEQVAGIAEHSRNAPRHRMTMEQRCEIYGDDCYEPQEGEEERAGAQLWLVKDSGIYLMSPAVYPDGEDPHKNAQAEKAKLLGTKPETTVPVAYAEGFNPLLPDGTRDYDCFDKCRDAVGGDDFAEWIPLEWVDRAIRDGYPKFAIRMTRDSIGQLEYRRKAS